MMASGWNIEYSEGGGQAPPSSHDTNPANYRPQPADMTTLSLSKDMMNLSERLSEDGHDIQALTKKGELERMHGGPIDLSLVPFDLLTESEKKKNRERCQELLKYIQFTGYNLYKAKREGGDSSSDAKNPENRFAYRLLEKLISYLDTAASSMKILKPSANFTRRNSFSRLIFNYVASSLKYFMMLFQAKQECQVLCPCGTATDREILWSHAQLLHSSGNGCFNCWSVNDQGEGVCGEPLLQACQLAEAKEICLWGRCTPGSEVSSDPDQGR